MKTTKLLKILASLAIVASMTACGGKKEDKKSESESKEPESTESIPSETSEEPSESEEEAIPLKMNEVVYTEFNADELKFESPYEGKLVTLDGVTRFIGEIGNGRILAANFVSENGSGKLADQFGVEIELAEGVELTKDGEDGQKVPLAYTDHLNVTGRVTLENGKVVIKEADVSFAGDGERVNFYWDADRGYFDALSDAGKAGMVVQGTMQMVEVPTTYSAETGAILKAVFPGEKILNSEDNDAIIEILIPAGLTDEQWGKYAEMFDGLKAGDGYKLTFATRYNYGMGGVIPYFFLGKTFTNGEKWFEPAEIKGIYVEYTDVLEEMAKFCKEDKFANFGTENAFSYKLETAKAGVEQRGVSSNCEVNAPYDLVGRLNLTVNSENVLEDLNPLIESVCDGTIYTDSLGNEMEWHFLPVTSAGTIAEEVEDIYYIFFALEAPNAEEEESEQSDSPAALALLDSDSAAASESEEEEYLYCEVIAWVSESAITYEIYTEIVTEEPLPTYTMDSVAADFNANLEPTGVQAQYEEDEEDWFLGAGLGAASDETEETLKSGAYFIADYLPDYLELVTEFYDDPAAEDFFDFFGVGIAVYYMVFTTPDGAVDVEILTYVYNSKLNVQVYISNHAASPESETSEEPASESEPASEPASEPDSEPAGLFLLA